MVLNRVVTALLTVACLGLVACRGTAPEPTRVREQPESELAEAREAPPASADLCAGQEPCVMCAAQRGADTANRLGIFCALQDGETCAETVACRQYGLCREVDGACALTDEACATHTVCTKSGRCSAGDGRECVARTDADCAQGAECRDGRGKCFASDGKCHFADQICESRLSDPSGGEAVDALLPRNGVCERVSCDDLASVQRFLEVGVPSAANESPPRVFCYRPEGKGCEQTAACKEGAFCEEDRDRCWHSDAGCARLPGCAERGECHRYREREPEFGKIVTTRSLNYCAPINDADCANSAVCKNEGRCFASDGECVAPPTCSPPEVLLGAYCVLPLGYDCAAECAANNRCDAVVIGGKSGDYVYCAETEEYCRGRPACKQRGICGRSVGGGCTKTESGCAKSVACRKFGDCSAATPSSDCRPTRKQHCERSEICKEEGQCKLLDESSYHICGD